MQTPFCASPCCPPHWAAAEKGGPVVYWGTDEFPREDRATCGTPHLVPAGRAREAERTLVVLGDSITYGWGLPYELSYPALLNRRLNEGVAGSRPWRVINAGVPGDTVLCAQAL